VGNKQNFIHKLYPIRVILSQSMPAQICLAVLSDIHGNLPALEAVLADLREQIPLDGILVAGDIAGGPWQQAVLERLADLGARMVQGNVEQGITWLALGTAPEYFSTARQFEMLRWDLANLSPEMIDLVCRLPDQAVWPGDELPGKAGSIRVVHGSPRRMTEPVSSTNLGEMLEKTCEPVMVFGHTHTPWQARIDTRLGMNPGAVSFSQTGFQGAQYALLEWDGERWSPAFREVRYDMERMAHDYRRSSFWQTGPLARVYLRSILTGVDYLPVFFGAARRLAQQAGCTDMDFFPDEVWNAADNEFNF
jgi:predicted phosphodiesterase